MERYFYFRDVADEANDSDDGASCMVPVKNITGIGPGNAITNLDIWFLSGKNESHMSNARLTVTRGKLKQVTEEIVAAMNAGPNHDGVTVIYDAMTTVDNASSIQGLVHGDDGTVSARSLSNDITGVALTSL
tara:strand:- start:49 stop:444 length:396 start_codon:yes stop_codon:yes gene_type:complete